MFRAHLQEDTVVYMQHMASRDEETASHTSGW